MDYVDVKINYEEPFGRLEQFYTQAGIFNLIDSAKEKYGIPQDALVSYQLIRCNQKTHDKLRDQLTYNWQYYNYDRNSGKVPGNRKLRKYKTKHKLSHGDEVRLAWHYGLGISPMVDETVPDDIIRVMVEWDEKIINDIKYRYVQDSKFSNL